MEITISITNKWPFNWWGSIAQRPGRGATWFRRRRLARQRKGQLRQLQWERRFCFGREAVKLKTWIIDDYIYIYDMTGWWFGT